MLQLALSYLDRIPDGTYLSVNLSPAALPTPRVSELLARAVASHPGRVVLELTEHEEVADYSALSELLDGMRRRGLRLAVDDAGAGYSSLQHVVRMRPDILKLDAVFGHDIDRDVACRAAARALIGFAKEIGASIVAEGIETPQELDVLRSLGATHGQGFLLGRPGPAELQLAP